VTASNDSDWNAFFSIAQSGFVVLKYVQYISMTSQSESFFDLVEKLAEWSTQDVEEHLVHTLPVLLISFACRSATFWNLCI